MDLKSFSNTDDYAAYREESILHEQSKQETTNKQQMSEQDVRDAIGQYSQLNNDQLMAELMKQVSAQKDKGNISSMQSTIEKIKPFLNPEQQKRLEVIIKQMGL